MPKGPMRPTRCLSPQVLVLVWAISSVACATGLHPHTTIAGQPFPAGQVTELHEGQTPEEVREVLGEPFEMQDVSDRTIWRFYEKANPRGCTTYLFGLPLGSRPESVSEALVTFHAGRVVSIRVHREGDYEVRSGEAAAEQ